MEISLLQINKRPIFPKLIKDPAYNFHVELVEIFDVNQNIVQIYYDRAIHYDEALKLLNKDVININLEACQKNDRLKERNLFYLTIGPKIEYSVFQKLCNNYCEKEHH